MEDMDDSCGWCTVENVTIDWPLQLTLHHECQTLVWQIEVTCGANWTNIRAGLLALGFASMTSREPGGNWLGSGSWSLSSLKLQPEEIWTTCAKNLEGSFNLLFPVLLLRSVILMQLVSVVVSFTVLTLQGSLVLVLEKCGGWPIFRRISLLHSAFRCCCSLLPKGGISHELKRLTEEMQKKDLTFLFKDP